jgi:hypothetical protein
MCALAQSASVVAVEAEHGARRRNSAKQRRTFFPPTFANNWFLGKSQDSGSRDPVAAPYHSEIKAGAEEGTRTPTPLRVHGPEPCASANSATSAWNAHTA